MSESNTYTKECEAAVVERVTREAALLGQKVQFPLPTGEGTPFILVPDGRGGMRAQDLEALLPPRRKARRSFNELESFLDYVKTFRDERTRLFCQANIAERRAVFWAVLDYHTPSTANAGQPEDATSAAGPWHGRDAGERCEHRAELVLQWTPEALAWLARNEKPMSQAEFADFLEDRYPDVVEPSGAEVLQVARTLEAKKDVNFKSSQRTHDGGWNAQYEETVQARAGSRGELEIPGELGLRVQLFQGCQPVEMRARLLFRVSGGGVTFGIKIHRFDAVVREQFASLRTEIAQELNLRVWSEA